MSEFQADMMPFTKLLGAQVTSMAPDQVSATLLVRDELCTTGGRLHGGAIMSLADSLGAVAAYLNLPEGAKATTTIESKTNFLGAAPAGTTVSAQCRALHVGRRTSVWQTHITSEAGKPVAVVTQTQMVL